MRRLRIKLQKYMKITINELEVIFDPETKHEKLALEKLLNAHSVSVRATDGWNITDTRISFIIAKDDWG